MGLKTCRLFLEILIKFLKCRRLNSFQSIGGVSSIKDKLLKRRVSVFDLHRRLPTHFVKEPPWNEQGHEREGSPWSEWSKGRPSSLFCAQ